VLVAEVALGGAAPVRMGCRLAARASATWRSVRDPSASLTFAIGSSSAMSKRQICSEQDPVGPDAGDEVLERVAVGGEHVESELVEESPAIVGRVRRLGPYRARVLETARSIRDIAAGVHQHDTYQRCLPSTSAAIRRSIAIVVSNGMPITLSK
jgi:hypothetical protein